MSRKRRDSGYRSWEDEQEENKVQKTLNDFDKEDEDGQNS